MIKNFDEFIFESYGSNKIVELLTKHIFDLVNANFGKLLLSKSIILKNELKTFNYSYNGKKESITFVNDIINIKISDRDYGNVNSTTLIVKKDFIFDLRINLELMISNKEIKEKRISEKNYFLGTVNHELHHLIEEYLTLQIDEKISKSFDDDKFLKILRNKYENSKEWQKIYYFIYLSLPHEMRARVSQIQELIKQQDIKGVEKVQNFIKNTKFYEDANFLATIDLDAVLQKMKMDENYNDLMLDINKLLFKNKKTTLKECEFEFEKFMNKLKIKNQYLLKKLLKTSYNFNEKNENYIHEDFFNTLINYEDYMSPEDYKKFKNQ